MFPRLLDRFYSRKTDGYRVLMAGLDGAGKTTLLYKLSLGEIITTIPALGLKIETVDASTTSGRNLTITCWDAGPACGTEFLVPMVLHCTENSDAIVWVVDSSDPKLLDESIRILGRIFRAIESYPKPRKNKDCPVLMYVFPCYHASIYPTVSSRLANKRDKPGAMTPLQVHNKFAPTCAHRRIFMVFPTSVTEDMSVGGIPEAFSWLQYAIENLIASPDVPGRDDTPSAPGPVSGPPDQHPSGGVSDKLDSWLARAKNDSTPEEFISQFENISLPSWDHYTHIRIAYVILTTHGRQKGVCTTNRRAFPRQSTAFLTM
jgi:ADP-ribosylation factor family